MVACSECDGAVCADTCIPQLQMLKSHHPAQLVFVCPRCEGKKSKDKRPYYVSVYVSHSITLIHGCSCRDSG